jgi:hypothetical protein
MQPYFDPTRKTTSKTKWKTTSKKILKKWKTTSKKCKKTSKKRGKDGRQPQKKRKKWNTTSITI